MTTSKIDLKSHTMTILNYILLAYLCVGSFIAGFVYDDVLLHKDKYNPIILVPFIVVIGPVAALVELIGGLLSWLADLVQFQFFFHYIFFRDKLRNVSEEKLRKLIKALEARQSGSLRHRVYRYASGLLFKLNQETYDKLFKESTSKGVDHGLHQD